MENKNEKSDVGMTSKQIEIVKTTWAMVAPLAEQVGPLFYNRLFEIAPETKPLFQRTSIPEQSKKLLAMLNYVISKLDKLETLLDEINALALRHVQYGVKTEHYEKVGAALLWTLEQGLQSAWTDETKDAWITCYVLLSGAMLQATNRKLVA
jgi:hemoglobin-like flavoprotein